VNCKCGIIPDRTTSLFEAGVERLFCKGRQAKLLNSDGMNLDGTYFTTTIPFVEFNIQFQTNSLIYEGYSIRQQMIYCISLLMKEEGLGYRRISRKLNQWGIMTHRRCEWFNTSVSSVLKRKDERDDLVNNIRNKHYPSKVSKMELKYYIFD